MKIALSGRVSKDVGTQDPENQLRPLREFAKSQGWEIVAEYVDYASGSKSDREQFQKMLNDADMRKFDLILVWALDRFSREGISNTLGYMKRLKRAGVAVMTHQEKWLDTRSDNPTAELLLSIFSWVADQERLRIVARTKEAIDKRKNDIKKNGFFIVKETGEKKFKLGRPAGKKDAPGHKRSSHKYYKSFNPKRAKKALEEKS